MFKKILICIWAISSSVCFAVDTNAILQKVDSYRGAYTHVRVDLTITDYKKESISNHKKYRVYREGKKSLVLVKSGSDRGNVILLSPRGMYLATKKSSRSIRITPIQRLIGQASYGDLGQIQFSKEYTVQSIETHGAYIKLYLHSKDRKISYKYITLWVDKKTYVPIKAQVYLNKQKVFKYITYDVQDGTVKRILYVKNPMSENKTILTINAITEKRIPKRFYSPKGMRAKIPE